MTSSPLALSPQKKTAARILKQDTAYDGFRRLDIVDLAPLSLRHDGEAPDIRREVVLTDAFALAVLYVPETDEILLNEQFRIGAFMAEPENAFLLEAACGMFGPDETPEAAIARETEEETGCRLLDLVSIGSFFTTPGCSNERAFLFVGRIARPDTASGIFGLEEEGEEIRTHLMPAQEVFRLLDEGHIRNIAPAMAISWLARHHERLRRDWLSRPAEV